MRRTAVTLTCIAAALLTGCGATAGSGAAAKPPAPPAPVSVPPSAPPSAGGAPACPGADRSEPGAPPTTIDGTPANTPEAVKLSQAVGAQGYGAFADVYGTHTTDRPAGRVAVCVTDLARGRLLLEAARKADPSVDPGRADLYLSRYTHRALMAAVERLTADQGRPAFPLYTFSAARDASGVVVTSTEAGAASKDLKARLEKITGGVPVTVERGDPVEPLVGTKPPKSPDTAAPVAP
ncbi:hypothetical protein EF910_28300 [Streptomyces sp. WAC07149]|uniref:hypothetical protein n=1 Tax=Streptomyces sp. WAC07149 TaxID=2487425 RepID=UPI000F7B4F04|nr:hypothetical protein [Streptomyces sp. WAC07149]RST01439.1 hypothetical protein EF910_28300 [Streptomyces sp. WAC07149]